MNIKTLKNAIREISGLNKINSQFIADAWQDDDQFDLRGCPSMYFKKFGEKNNDKYFYIIRCDRLGGGFFANVRHVTGNIIIARHYGFTPIVDFQNFKTFYNESSLINGTYNSWEYYFEQVSPYKLSEVYESANVFFLAQMPSQITDIVNVNKFFTSTIQSLNIHKYIKDQVDIFFKKHFCDKRVLGIHFRGKEMNISSGHSFGPTIEQVINFADQIISNHSIDKVFLVTEEKDYLDALSVYYGDKLIFTDCLRVSKINAYNIHPRDNHRYLLGLEVLIDAILLSRCNGLLCGESGVSSYAINTNEKYEFAYKINNGLNFKNPYLARYAYNIKRRLPSFLGGLRGQLQEISLDNRCDPLK